MLLSVLILMLTLTPTNLHFSQQLCLEFQISASTLPRDLGCVQIKRSFIRAYTYLQQTAIGNTLGN